MRLTVPSPAARHVAALVLLIVALLGAGFVGSSSASTETIASLRASEAADCAEQATGPVDDTLALAVCTDLDADLVGIGKLLGLPALTPTGSSLTTPVEVDFSEDPAPNDPDHVFMETRYFGSVASPVPAKWSSIRGRTTK